MDKKNTPEVKLGQYKGLAVTRHVRPVTDKTVDIELVHQTRMHAVYHPTTEPAKRGFRALLDFAGYMDGKEIPDSRMEKVMVVLGDGKLMPAAEQAIYGHRAGEVFRFDFTYPQDFRLPELSGKTAQFEIELRSHPLCAGRQGHRRGGKHRRPPRGSQRRIPPPVPAAGHPRG